MFSKLQQPEAVPALNFLSIGSENFPIRRLLALRDSIFVFKRDGVFKITGTTVTGDLRVDSFDNSITIKAPETAQILDNQIYTFSDQGVVVISETGADLKSFPIETELLETSSSQFSNFENIAFATPYESDRKYLLFLLTASTDTVPTQVAVFNYITEAWTKWTVSRTAAVVHPDQDKLYLSNPESDFLYVERKEFDRLDFADEEFSITITGTVSGTPTTSVGFKLDSNVLAGQTLRQNTTESVISTVVSGTMTLNTETTWEDGAAKTYTPISTKVQFVPEAAGNVGIMKHIREVDFLFTNADLKMLL